jgi:hypothetical protein
MKLRPCPFCGFVSDTDDFDCIYPVNRERTAYNLVCTNHCGCEVVGSSPEDCIEIWNHRYTDKVVVSGDSTEWHEWLKTQPQEPDWSNFDEVFKK